MLPNTDTPLRRRRIRHSECVRPNIRDVGGDDRRVRDAGVRGQLNGHVAIESTGIRPRYCSL